MTKITGISELPEFDMAEFLKTSGVIPSEGNDDQEL